MNEVREAAPSSTLPLMTQEPPRRIAHILLYVGPGMILAGNIVGSGELIATPRLSAETGYTFLWLILFSCVIKTFFQIEIGRYALSTGRTTLDSFNSLPGPRAGVSWINWCWVVMAICSTIQIGAMVGGVAQALRLALPFAWPHAEKVYAVATGLSVVALLVNGRYGRIEKIALGMVTLFTIITLYSLVQIQLTPFAIRADDVAHGMSFHLPQRPDALVTALMAFGITGVGASELVAYPYWCLEKGYGRAVGPRDASEGWARRARGWIRVMQWDAWLATGVFTLATVAFFLLGAAMLHSQGQVPEGPRMVETLNLMYTETFGAYAKYIFLLGAVCVLYSTLFTATAGNARMFTDWAGLLGAYDRSRPEGYRRGILILSILIPIFCTVLYLSFGTPVLFVIIGGIAQALMLPLVGIAVLYFAYRHTDHRVSGGPVWMSLLWLSLLLCSAASLYGGYRVAYEHWDKLKAFFFLG